MKRIKLGIISLVMFLIPVFVSAGSISVSGANTVIVGNNVTVSVKLSGEAASWQVQLDYDKNLLDFVSSSAEAGGTYMVGTSTSNPGRSYSFTFKAKKSGNANVAISSYLVYKDDMTEVSMSKGSKSIRLMTQAELEATYSKDNYLKDLSVNDYELTPAFDREVSEYTVTVPSDVTKVNINATKNDGTATVSGTGEFDVVEGSNSFEIVVTAQNGSTRKYTVNVVVEDLNPIIVKIDGIEYTVIKREDILTSPALFESTTVDIDGVSVPGFYNETTKFNIVGLKDESGKIYYAIYDNQTKKYSLYNARTSDSIILYILDLIDINNNKYKKSTVKIGKVQYDAYKVSKKSKFAIVYAMNMATGNKDFYVYDMVNKTFTLYDKELINNLTKMNNTYLMAIALISSAFLLTFISLIVVSCKKKCKVRKNKNEGIDEEFYGDIKNNDIKENVTESIEEKFDNIENDMVEDKAKKNRKEKKEKKQKKEKVRKKEFTDDDFAFMLEKGEESKDNEDEKKNEE